MNHFAKTHSPALIYFALIYFFLTGFPVICFSQLIDDFSDGDFTNDPVWIGETDLFKINGGLQLQLNGTTAGSAYLSTENQRITDTEWQFWVQLSFSPSANNNTRVYLAADHSNPEMIEQAFFLQLGESGSGDALELFRQSGDETVSICRGTPGLLSSAFEARVKAIHHITGDWEIFIDPLGGTNFQLECCGTDDAISNCEFFGIHCNYTTSNKTKMYFDDFYIGPIIIDTLAPYVQELIITSVNSLDIRFSEPVEKITAELVSNYMINPGSYFPIHAFRNENEPEYVYLNFQQQFVNGTFYTLVIHGVEDLAGNATLLQEYGFTYFSPQPFDVVINEIMADPTPVVGLPAYEYIELANNTGFTVSLTNWALQIGTSVKTFGEAELQPGSYLILGRENYKPYFEIFGDFYGFSSFSLPNTGQDITLRDKYGNLISTVTYKDTWYNDENKDDGGYALEQIDQYNPCLGMCNWKASEHITGGSPGCINSVFEENNIPPTIDAIGYIDNQTFELRFSQTMDSISLLDPGAYFVDRGIGSPYQVIVSDPAFRKVKLLFDTPIEKQNIYSLTLTDTLLNCSGLYLLPGNHVLLGQPTEAQEKDLVINEVLFYPLGRGVEYLEVYNRSDHIIDLSECWICTVNHSYPNPSDTNCYPLSPCCVLLLPEGFMVFTKNPGAVQDQYFTLHPENFLTVASFPSLNNTSGTLLLKNRSHIIDMFTYDEMMHYPLLNYVQGVSLERINYHNNTQDHNNWHSASGSVGFGTPGYENSQFVGNMPVGQTITIQPEVFSPDGDGHHDVLNIHYDFEEPGYNLSITIFDASGNLVKNLVSNELIGTHGFFSWNGYDEDNQLAGIGIYVIFVEAFDIRGHVKRYKKTGVLGGRL